MIQLPRSSPVMIDDEAPFTVITIAPPPSSMLRIPCLILLGALSAIWLTLWCRFSHHVFFITSNAGIEAYLLIFVFTICGTFPVSLFVKLLLDSLRGPIAEQLICYEHELEFDSGIPPLMIPLESLPPSQLEDPNWSPADRSRRRMSFLRADVHSLTLREGAFGSSLTISNDEVTVELARFSDEIGLLWVQEFLTARYLQPMAT